MAELFVSAFSVSTIACGPNTASFSTVSVVTPGRRQMFSQPLSVEPAHGLWVLDCDLLKRICHLFCMYGHLLSARKRPYLDYTAL